MWKRSFIFYVRTTVHANPSWKRSFSKTLFIVEEFENGGFALSVDRKHFENGAFRTQWRHNNHVISLPESVPQTQIQNNRWLFSLLRSRHLGRHATLLVEEKRCETKQITAAKETCDCCVFRFLWRTCEEKTQTLDAFYERKRRFQIFPAWYGWGHTEHLSSLPIRLRRDDFIEFHVLTLNSFSKNKKKTSKKNMENKNASNSVQKNSNFSLLQMAI